MALDELELPDTLRKALIDRIETNKQDLIQALMDLALGIIVAPPGERTNTGKMKIYEKPPDKEAIMYLLNQVIGKPKEQMRISAGSGAVEFVFKKPSDGEINKEDDDENRNSVQSEEVG